MERGFAVVGLGYVGLPVALALAKQFTPVIGFDISSRRIDELRNGRDVTGEVSEAELRASQSDTVERSRCARSGKFLYRHGPDADRLGAPSGPFASRKRLCIDRSEAAARFGRRIRIDRLSGLDARHLRTAIGEVLGSSAGYRFQARLLAGEDQSRRPRTSPRDDHENRRGRGRRYTGAGRRGVWPHCPRRYSSGAVDRGRRSGEGHRKYPARSQHCVDERACDYFRSA